VNALQTIALIGGISPEETRLATFSAKERTLERELRSRVSMFAWEGLEEIVFERVAVLGSEGEALRTVARTV
jgi:hypothetical protein